MRKSTKTAAKKQQTSRNVIHEDDDAKYVANNDSLLLKSVLYSIDLMSVTGKAAVLSYILGVSEDKIDDRQLWAIQKLLSS